jgi:hypothetical protein
MGMRHHAELFEVSPPGFSAPGLPGTSSSPDGELPNGNTVIASYHATGDRVKLCEVTREKQVVWSYMWYGCRLPSLPDPLHQRRARV